MHSSFHPSFHPSSSVHARTHVVAFSLAWRDWRARRRNDERGERMREGGKGNGGGKTWWRGKE